MIKKVRYDKWYNSNIKVGLDVGQSDTSLVRLTKRPHSNCYYRNNCAVRRVILRVVFSIVETT